MDITVILCTYNRSKTLAKTLESIAASQLTGTAEWEALVVDNNSRDQTREVVEDFCRRYPGRFRYAFEPQQGKSYALNKGVRESRGEILAFADDDVTVAPTWLENLTAPLLSGGCEWAGCGGRIVPTHTSSLPGWLALEGRFSMLGIVCAHFDFGDKPFELDPYHAPYGANMAYRKSTFEAYGAFRTDLGPGAGGEIRNEDTEFGRRLIRTGERLRYEPSAVVYHPMPPARLKKKFFLRWWFDYGRALVREWRRGPSVLGIPRPYFNILSALILALPSKMLRWILAFNPQERFYYKCLVWMTVGQMREYLRLLSGGSEMGIAPALNSTQVEQSANIQPLRSTRIGRR